MKSISQRLLRGGITAVVGRSAVAVGVVLVNALVARLLSPEDTGLFMLALSMVTVAAVFADFGFGKTLLRIIPDAIASGDNVRAQSHIQRVFLAGILTIFATALLLVSPFGVWIAGKLSHGSSLGELMPLVALWLIVTVVISLLAETCRGFHHIAAAIFYGGALTGLGNILIVSFVLGITWYTSATITLKQVISLFILAGFFLAVLALFGLLKWLRTRGVSTDRSIKQLFIMAWPFWISSLALILLTHAEIWILGYLRSPEEVAIFALVAKLALLVSFPLVIVNSVLPPLISELYAKENIKKMERMLRISAGLTTLCSSVIFLILLIFGNGLLSFLFGDYYAGNRNMMMILAVGWLFHVWAGSGGFVLNMTDNQRSAMIINLVAGFLTLLAGLWLTSLYGGLGMAIASSSGLILVNVFMLLVIRYKLNIRIYAGLSGLHDLKEELIKRRQARQQRATD
ncbi:MAG: oligosaccharide flippase family protein [Gammaproteobacteria bacterium]|nr:oligosaccharide flippase family protein [Gammaproteobacteria bacterium]